MAKGHLPNPIAYPLPLALLAPEQILLGPKVDPLDRIKIMSAEEFEALIQEWAYFYLQEISQKYTMVARIGGAGDLGRDVIGYITRPSNKSKCDIFQCKHYDHALYPSDIWPELGKLCYHTFTQSFPIPASYRFLSPRDVGPEANKLLADPNLMLKGLKENWDKVRIKVNELDFKLKGDFLAYMNAFPFTIVGYKPILELVSEHEKTKRYAARFGGGLQKELPTDKTPPKAIRNMESRYVKQLIAAYGEHLGDPVFSLAKLPKERELNEHFARSRERFYCAETLREFARDALPENAPYEDVQSQVLDAVIDTATNDHPSGYARVIAVSQVAVSVQITNHPLRSYLKSKSLQGICHQLANTDRLTWVKK